MNILYFSPEAFYPACQGNRSTIYQYVKKFKELGHKVHFVLFCDNLGKNFDYFKMNEMVESLDLIPNTNLRNEKKDADGYHIFDTKYQTGLGEIVSKLCKRYSIDMVFCTYIFQSKILDYVPENIIKVIDTHDRMTDRHVMLAKNKIPDEFFSCREEDEAKYLDRADLIIARREEEANFFNDITKSKKAISVPHFEPAKYIQKDLREVKKVGILASNNKVNLKMVVNFLEAFNARREKNPIDVEIIVGGNVNLLISPDLNFSQRFLNIIFKLLNKPEKMFQENKNEFLKDGITVIGRINDVRHFYEEVDLVLIPITMGTGINVKMVETMSFGLPLISTECGIKGMNSNSCYHHCSDIEELIDKLYEIKQNPSILRDLAKVSRDCYDEFYSKSLENFKKILECKK